MGQELLTSISSFQFLSTDPCPIIITPGDTIIVEFYLVEGGGMCYGSLHSTATRNGITIEIESLPFLQYQSLRITTPGEYRVRTAWQQNNTPPLPSMLDPEVRFTVVDAQSEGTNWSLRGLRLQGAHVHSDHGRMRTTLLSSGSLPQLEPYTALGWNTGGSGGEEIPSDGLLTYPYARAVDWIRLELYTDATLTNIMASSNALLLSTGFVRSPLFYGSSIPFNAPIGTYYLRVVHRNHLPVTFGPFLVDQLVQCVDLTIAPVFGEDTRTFIGTIPHLRAGNALFDEGRQRISYTGSNNDRDAILQRIGGTNPTATVLGYFNEDVNLDGVVKYTGVDNDRDIILQAIGGVNPIVVVNE